MAQTGAAPVVSARTVFRVVISLAVLPLAAAALMFATVLAMSCCGFWIFEGGAPRWWAETIDAAESLSLSAAMLAAPMTAVAAAPIALWVQEQRPLRLGRLVLMGAALGNVPFAAVVVGILLMQFLRGALSWDAAKLWYGWRGAARMIALGSYFGPALAALFWTLGVRGGELQAPRESPRA